MLSDFSDRLLGKYRNHKKHLDAGVDIYVLDKKYGFASLHYAAEGGYKEIVQLLMVKGEDVNQGDKIGKTPTYWAI